MNVYKGFQIIVMFCICNPRFVLKQTFYVSSVSLSALTPSPQMALINKADSHTSVSNLLFPLRLNRQGGGVTLTPDPVFLLLWLYQ